MKVLAIDAGNTRVKWGLAEDDRWIAVSSVATAEATMLASAFGGLPDPDRIVVSNVAGPLAGQHIAAALLAFEAVPRFVKGAARQCGVRSAYDDPAQLGPDRWAALIGAWHLVGGPCIVANAGTTLTADALTAEGAFIGGIIVPGMDLMRATLADHTAHLTMQEGSFTYFPARTGDAIVSGAMNALAGAVERMLRYMLETGATDPLVVVSGGAAAALAPRLNARVELVDNLVLEGLVRIALEM